MIRDILARIVQERDASTPKFVRFEGKDIGRAAADDIARAAFPGHAPELVEALKERAAREISAASELPIDSTASLADAHLVGKGEALGLQHADARAWERAAVSAHREAQRRQAALPQPHGFVVRAVVPSLALLGTALIAFAIAALLAPSVDMYLMRSYMDSVLSADAEQFSAQISFCVALACSAGLLGCQLLATVVTHGRLGHLRKCAMLVADIAFAGAFAVLRLGEVFTWQAVAVSVFEFSLTMVATILVLALASSLSSNRDRAEPYQVARSETEAAVRDLRTAREVVVSTEMQLAEYFANIAKREDAVRRETRLHDLAHSAVTAECLVGTSRLMNEEARNASEETFLEAVDRKIAARFPGDSGRGSRS